MVGAYVHVITDDVPGAAAAPGGMSNLSRPRRQLESRLPPAVLRMPRSPGASIEKRVEARPDDPECLVERRGYGYQPAPGFRTVTALPQGPVRYVEAAWQDDAPLLGLR